MAGVNLEMITAYLAEKEKLDTREASPPMAVWLLNLMNMVFKTAFNEGPEDYMTIYERGRKQVQLLSTLSTREKIAVGLRLGQFYAHTEFTEDGDMHRIRTTSMLKDWSVEQQLGYHARWANLEAEDHSVLQGPIKGDVPQDQLTEYEQAEVAEKRRLRAEAGPGERTVLRWKTADFSNRMASC